MSQVFYETFQYPDANFRITFHPDSETLGRPAGFVMHWHEHIEILLFTVGGAALLLDDTSLSLAENDIAVINANVSHQMPEKDPATAYHCLIIDKQFCDFMGVSVDTLHFCTSIRDRRLRELILSVAAEMSERKTLYKVRVQSLVLELLVLLAREHSGPAQLACAAGSTQKQTLIKKAIGYIAAHYQEPMTIEEISEQVGLSKYYFCRSFKEVAGQRVFDYINLVRCTQAHRLLGSGRYTITQCAYAVGFHNLSYFTRTYRRFMGRTPSSDLPRQ